MSKRINMSEVLGFTFHLMVYQVSHNNLVFNRKAWEKFLEDELQISETKYSESIINSLVLSKYLIKKDEEIYINKNKIMDEQKSIVKMFNRQKDYDLELRRYSLYEGNHFLDMVKLILIELEARGSHSYNEDYLYKAFREVSLPVNKRQLEEITLKLMSEGWILGNGYTKSIRVPVGDDIRGKIYAMFNAHELEELDIIVSKYIGPTLMFNMNDGGMKR